MAVFSICGTKVAVPLTKTDKVGNFLTTAGQVQRLGSQNDKYPPPTSTEQNGRENCRMTAMQQTDLSNS